MSCPCEHDNDEDEYRFNALDLALVIGTLITIGLALWLFASLISIFLG